MLTGVDRHFEKLEEGSHGQGHFPFIYCCCFSVNTTLISNSLTIVNNVEKTSHESYMREYPYSVFVMAESIIIIKGVYIAFSFKGASNELSEDPISISV